MIPNCPFCEIRKEQRVLEETNYCYVIFSNPRIQPGHLLVIPKKHIEKLSELDSLERKEILELLARYQEKILESLGEGCEIRQNYKPYLTNSRIHVDHLHFHIHPREKDDEVAGKVDKHRKSLFKDLTQKELKEMLKIFK